jgi:hypothetical protein
MWNTIRSIRVSKPAALTTPVSNNPNALLHNAAPGFLGAAQNPSDPVAVKKLFITKHINNRSIYACDKIRWFTAIAILRAAL